MRTQYKFTQSFFSIVILLILILSSFHPPEVHAQGTQGIKRQVNAQTGKVSFLLPESGLVLPARQALNGMSPGERRADPAMALAKQFGAEFGLKDPERELVEIQASRLDNGHLKVRYQQTYHGIPVIGGELIVHTNEDGDLYSINGEVSTDLSLPTEPAIPSEQAQRSALGAMAKWYQKTSAVFIVSEPRLWIFDASLLMPSSRPRGLVWRMEVTSMDYQLPVRELVLVDAVRGNISLHFNQIDTAWAARSSAEINTMAVPQGNEDTSAAALADALSADVATYTARNGPASRKFRAETSLVQMGRHTCR
jgi:Zn-dependent metalloprotease